MRISKHANWSHAISRTFKFFSGREYSGERVEARIEFYSQILLDLGVLGEEKSLVNIGAGITWLDPIARCFGNRVTIIDDFNGGGGIDLSAPLHAESILGRFQSELGIHVVAQDVLNEPLPEKDSSADVVVCINSLEHWHHSPKALFGEITRILKPGGVLLLGTPNAVNLRKRITVLLGYNNWDRLEWWYDETPFRGHVREPIVSDLHRICRWNDLSILATYGRNFIGRDSKSLAWIPRPLRVALAVGGQSVMRFFPTLCSDITVIARK